MPSVYVVNADGSSEPMSSVNCKNEDKELQQLLEKNPNLLPGEQIDPDSPCRWMLIRREMPVPDPVTGAARWSVDFLFADQSATPTFVECKRYLDTRARREVVGQVLEYAANARHYWTAAGLKEDAQATAARLGLTLETSFGQLQSDLSDSVDDFFQEFERRLKANDIRVVLFLEAAPAELRRLVEFLNTELKSLDVLLVEARQYERNGTRIVVPTLYGFTEQIRAMKSGASGERAQKPLATDWESFKASAQHKGLDEPTIAALRRLFDACKSLDADIGFGRGTVTASFSPRWLDINPKVAPFSAYSNGKLEMHFPGFQGTAQAKAFADQFASVLSKNGLTLPANYQSTWYQYDREVWVPVADAVIEALRTAVGASRSSP